MVTQGQLDAYLEKKMVPQLTLKLSVEVAEGLIHMIEHQVNVKAEAARACRSPVSVARIMNEAELWRAMYEKLARACTEWHKKNPMEGA
jgi:hypothetical protein